MDKIEDHLHKYQVAYITVGVCLVVWALNLSFLVFILYFAILLKGETRAYTNRSKRNLHHPGGPVSWGPSLGHPNGQEDLHSQEGREK